MKMLLLGMALAAIGAEMLQGCAGKDATEQPAREVKGLAVATFAGGCFWCVEADFEKVPGVVTATSGYTGGHTHAPSYEQVSSGTTGHREAVEVHYDPKIVSYGGLVQAYWRMVNPTDAGGQFGDRGPEYTTAIWYHTETQRVAAEHSKTALDTSGRYRKPVVTPILPATRFYMAEDKHQDYYLRHPMSYRFYRHFSGRDKYLKRTWGSDLQVDFDAFSVTPESDRAYRSNSTSIPSVRHKGRPLSLFLSSISEKPRLNPVIHERVGRALLHRFPFRVFYQLDEPYAVVLGAMHAKRDPSQWKQRA